MHHLRSNVIAYLALIVALGGTSYAAINLPANSVGSRQLKNGSVTTDKLANGSVTPKKLDGTTIGGSVLHWAFIDSNGQVIGGSRGTKSSLTHGFLPYKISWGDRFSHSCAVLANSPGREGFAPIADSVGIHVNAATGKHDVTTVWIWPSSAGGLVQARVYLAVIC